MKSGITSVVRSAVLTVALLGLFAGCASKSGYQQADKTGAGIDQFRNDIVDTKKAVDTTLSELGNITTEATVDPRKPYLRFAKSSARLESAVKKAQERAAAIREQGSAYFLQWEKDLVEVNNPEIRSLSHERKAELKEAFNRIGKAMQVANGDFKPFVSDVKDLEKYLGADLTVAGITAANDLIKKTKTEGATVQQSLDAVIHELVIVEAALTPARNK